MRKFIASLVLVMVPAISFSAVKKKSLRKNSTQNVSSVPAPVSPTPPQMLRSPTCTADFNNDGVVNAADMHAIRDAFNLLNMTADFDLNGRVEPVDMAVFTNAYASQVSNPACMVTPTPPPAGASYTEAVPTRSGTYKSKIIYVSNIACSNSAPEYFADNALIGNDPKNPVGAVVPLCSLADGYARLRSGYPDWLLVKKGSSHSLSSRIMLTKSGRSATERQVISSYGTGARPVVVGGPDPNSDLNAGVVFFTGYYSTQYNMIVNTRHVIISSLEFKPRTGEEYKTVAISMYGGEVVGGAINVTDMIFEDNKFSKFQRAISFDWVSNSRMYRNIFEDMAGRNMAGVCADGQYHPGFSGFAFYFGTTENMVAEENIILQKFFTYGIRTPCAQDNMAYIENASRGTTLIKKNIVINKGDYSNVGLFSRSSGTEFRDNVIYGVNASLDLASQDEGGIYPSGTHGSAIGNIILRGSSFAPGQQGGVGILIHATDTQGWLVKDNIVANLRTPAETSGIELSQRNYSTPPRNNRIENNIIYNWNGLWAHPGYREQNGQLIQLPMGTGNQVVNNEIQQTSNQTLPLVLATVSINASQIAFSGNKYHSVRGPSQWFDMPENNYSYTTWRTTYESSAVQQNMNYPNPNADHLLTYAPGLTTVDAVMSALSAQSRDNWRSDVGVDRLIAHTRAGFGRQ